VTEIKNNPPNLPDNCSEPPDADEINIMDYWRKIWKRRMMILGIMIIIIFLTAIYSLFMKNIYQAKTIIMPVTQKDTGGGAAGLAALASQLGGVPGIAIPSSATVSEIVGLLKSNILREKMIQQYNLMPILFYKKWDEEKQAWRKGGGSGISLNPLAYLSMLSKSFMPSPPKGLRKKDPDVPDMQDAIRLLDRIVRINREIKENTITITVDYHDPEIAAKIVEYYLATLTNYMSSETKRVANTNRKYLEEQLGNTSDPFIKQKTYNLIAQQIETAMMAEVKENFAFKVIDPPRVPDKKIKPKRVQMLVLSFIVSLFIGILAVLFIDYIKNTRALNNRKL